MKYALGRDDYRHHEIHKISRLYFFKLIAHVMETVWRRKDILTLQYFLFFIISAICRNIFYSAMYFENQTNLGNTSWIVNTTAVAL